MKASIAPPFKSRLGSKTLPFMLFGTVLLLTNEANAVSQTPLSLKIGVPPNLILTIDDSTSMNRAFVPDVGGDNNAQDRNDVRVSRRGKSAAFNPMYYDPAIIYQAPASFNSAGNEVLLDSTFNKAFMDGFAPGKNNGSDWLDLRSSYRPAWSYNRSSNGQGNYANNSNAGLNSILATNPSSDFSAQATLTNNNTSRTITTNGDLEFILARGKNNNTYSCSVKLPGSTASIDITDYCSRSSSTYTADLTQVGMPAYYYVYDKAATDCPTSAPRTNDDCYRLVFVTETSGSAKLPNGTTLSDERKNFAIWYSFYRNRALATLSAASIAFYDLSSSSRLTWQSLIHCKTLNSSSGGKCGLNQFRSYTAEHRKNFFNWLQNTTQFDDAAGTPLRSATIRAGEFLKEDIAWQKEPGGSGNTTANTYSCRPSYHVVMTDGMWTNTNETIANPAQNDAAAFTLPDNKRFNGNTTPFSDSTSATLADIAMHYWATDLKGNLANGVKPTGPKGDAEYWNPRANPATWQHMVNYMMGLGLSESLNQSNIPWEGGTFVGRGYQALADGTASWPAASSGSQNNVYDLWHAAINSRGEFFSVDSPSDMVQAFTDILSNIGGRTSSAARPAINSGQVSTDENENGVVKTISYQTSYSSENNWSGDLKRFEKKWNTTTNNFETSQSWSASEQVPAAANRNIKIAGGTDNSGLQEFNWANAGAATSVGTLAYYLNRNPESANAIDTRGEARLSYIRGNRSGEGSTFRIRSSLLGDFYSSSPVVVTGARYLEQFSNRLENNTAYTRFKQSIAERKPRVYVGGNDGMLHGFNASTGVEEFAFIPSSVFPKLNQLTGTNYGHQFYVDGPPTVADVYDGTNWRTILVGTLKAGGKSIFALDITYTGQEKLLWQFDENSITTDGAVKMGYSFSQPTIARLHTGKWGVVFGNGYDSTGNTNGKAALFILDAIDGTLVRSLEVQGTNGVANGLSTPKLGDFNADGTADYAYAGDLQGNMWRFDLLRTTRDANAPFKVTNDVPANNFRVGFGGEPLFRASADNAGRQRQAITSAPSLVIHPTGTGYLVIFGTGRFYADGDKEGDKSMSQSVYGIWDKQTLGEIANNPSISRSSLQEQTITSTTTVSANGSSVQGRTLSNNPVRWQQTTDSSGSTLSAQNGWFLNLVRSDGEMVVENMSQLGRTIFFQSLVPNSDPCGDGANNWTYAVNPYSGGRTTQKAFDYAPTSDVGTTIVSAVRQDGEGGGTVSQNSDSSYQYCTGQSCINIYPDPTSIGRQAWRRTEEQQ